MDESLLSWLSVLGVVFIAGLYFLVGFVVSRMTFKYQHDHVAAVRRMTPIPPPPAPFMKDLPGFDLPDLKVPVPPSVKIEKSKAAENLRGADYELL